MGNHIVKNISLIGSEVDLIKEFIKQFTNSSSHVKYLPDSSDVNTFVSTINDVSDIPLSTVPPSNGGVICSFLIDDAFVLNLRRASGTDVYDIIVCKKTNLNTNILPKYPLQPRFSTAAAGPSGGEDNYYRTLIFSVVDTEDNFIFYNSGQTTESLKWGLWFLTLTENNNEYHYVALKYNSSYYYSNSVDSPPIQTKTFYHSFIPAENNRLSCMPCNKIPYTYDILNTNNIEFIKCKTFMTNNNTGTIQKIGTTYSCWDVSEIPEYLIFNITINNSIIRLISIDNHTLVPLSTTTTNEESEQEDEEENP